jgi:hypothetical protein
MSTHRSGGTEASSGKGFAKPTAKDGGLSLMIYYGNDAVPIPELKFTFTEPMFVPSPIPFTSNWLDVFTNTLKLTF